MIGLQAGEVRSCSPGSVRRTYLRVTTTGRAGFPAMNQRTLRQNEAAAFDRDYFGARGSIGVVSRTPRMSSSTLDPASNFASARGFATIWSPTGKPEAVKPQGSDSAGQHTSVIA